MQRFVMFVFEFADYRRTQIVFALLSIMLMLMALLAAFYTFKNGRYMYKRLASGLSIICGE